MRKPDLPATEPLAECSFDAHPQLRGEIGGRGDFDLDDPFMGIRKTIEELRDAGSQRHPPFDDEQLGEVPNAWGYVEHPVNERQALVERNSVVPEEELHLGDGIDLRDVRETGTPGREVSLFESDLEGSLGVAAGGVSRSGHGSVPAEG